MRCANVLTSIIIDWFVNVYSFIGLTFAVAGKIDAIVLGGSDEIALGGVGARRPGVMDGATGGVYKYTPWCFKDDLPWAGIGFAFVESDATFLVFDDDDPV